MNYTLITGASAGIGEATARKFAAQNHNLILVARNVHKLRLLKEELSGNFGVKVEYLVADLSIKDAPGHIYEECRKRNLVIDVLINNAGIGSSGEFVENALETELAIIQINCASLMALTHLVLHDMKSRNSGTIINLGSMIAFVASPYMSVYAASKHFVKVFTYSLAEECKLYAVDVLFFCPGLTSSDFMNTRANNNRWGKALTEGSNTQSPQEVAEELFRAFEKKKALHVSGSTNRRMALLSGLFPLRTIARMFARQKQKQMGLIGKHR